MTLVAKVESRAFQVEAAEIALLGAGVVFTLLVFAVFVLILRKELKREKSREHVRGRDERASDVPATAVSGADARGQVENDLDEGTRRETRP